MENPPTQDRLSTRKAHFASSSHITLSLKQFLGKKRKGAVKSNSLALAPDDTLFSSLTHLRKKCLQRVPTESLEDIHKLTTVLKGVSKMISSNVAQHLSHWNACKNSGGENGSSYSTDRPQTLICNQLI